MKQLFKDPVKDMLLIGSLTAVAVLSGILVSERIFFLIGKTEEASQK